MNTMTHWTTTSRSWVLAGLFGLAAASAQALDPVNKTLFAGLAIKGYDPVAYFEDGKPVAGAKDFEYEWKGAKWRFASAAHRDRFAANPDQYAPQYGGYCAKAVSEGDTADISPDAWKIVDGKLYLNYDRRVQKIWEANYQERIQQGDKHWQELSKAGK